MPERFYQVFFEDDPAADDFYPQVIEIEVEDNADQADTFRIRLGIRLQDDGSWTNLDDDRFGLFKKVRVEAGFSDGSTEVLTEGYITEVDLHFEDPAQGPFMDIRGLDASVLMSLEEKIVTWPNTSDSDIATQILSGYGFTPDVTSTNPTHQDNDVTVIQHATDLLFLRQLARKNGFEVGVERDFTSGQTTGYFRPPGLSSTPQKTLGVAFGDESSLKSFDVRLDGLKPLNVAAAQIAVKDKSANTSTSDAMQLTAIGSQDLGALVNSPQNSLASPKDAAGKLWLTADPASDLNELTAMTQAVRDEAGWLVTAQGEINSGVYATVLRADRLVLVKGAGSLYSGKYYVTRVIHRLKVGGAYEQTFQARRNAIGLDGSEDFSSGSGLPF